MHMKRFSGTYELTISVGNITSEHIAFLCQYIHKNIIICIHTHCDYVVVISVFSALVLEKNQIILFLS